MTQPGSPNIASDVAAGVKVDHRPWPGTKPGLKITREVMALKIREGMHTPSVRALAGQILRDAGFPKTIRDKAEALRSYVKSHVDYAPDPQFSEMVVAAPITLCLDGVFCMPIADCDDATVACQSLVGAAGMDARFFHIEYGGNVQTHMMGAVRDDAGKWLEVDATTDRPVGYETKCSRKALVDPFDAKTFDLGATGAGGGSFIGVGKAFVGAGRAWDDAGMSGYAAAIFGGRRDTGSGAPQLTLQPCFKFSLDLDLQGATAADVAASLPTWASRVRNLYVGSFGNSTTLTGTWIGTSTFTVPASIPVSHDFGGYTGFATVQVLVTGGVIGALDTTGGCVPLPGPSTCPAGTHWDGNACVAQVVFKQPAPIPLNNGNTQVVFKQPAPIPLNNGNTKATYNPPASGSSKTPYYVAGGVAVVALVGGLIWWKAA